MQMQMQMLGMTDDDDGEASRRDLGRRYFYLRLSVGLASLPPPLCPKTGTRNSAWKRPPAIHLSFSSSPIIFPFRLINLSNRCWSAFHQNRYPIAVSILIAPPTSFAPDIYLSF
jgi:hypothetical protein